MTPGLDRERSLAAAAAIRPEPRACYKNALLALLTVPELRAGWYVEGFAVPVIGGVRLPLEHGWVALPGGRVIDPSLAALGHTDVAYFPAIRLSRRRAERLVEDDQPLPYLLCHRTARHRAAHLRAQAAANAAAFGPSPTIG